MKQITLIYTQEGDKLPYTPPISTAPDISQTESLSECTFYENWGLELSMEPTALQICLDEALS